MLTVAFLLTLIWGIYFLHVRKHVKTGTVFFVMLLMMVIPSWLEMNFLKGYIVIETDYFNICVLGILLILGFKPWLEFDKSLRSNAVIKINPRYIQRFKVIFTILIICSLISIIYLLPYAIEGISAGAKDRRAEIQGSTVLPDSFLTTIVVGIAALNIYNALFFFISCLHPVFKRYRIWLMISSLSYIVNCFAFTARDGLIILPIFYIVFFSLFKNSMNLTVLRKIKKLLYVLVALLGLFLVSFTLSRFYANKNMDEFYNGTLGYIAEQPYVFDNTIQLQDDFHGFELRFPLINRLFGIPKYEVDRSGTGYETQFGTMYAEFYSIGGWTPLIVVALVFFSYYYLSIKYLYRSRKYFGLILMFTVYLYIEVTGLFYCKAGSTVLINIFYITLSIIPLYIGNYIYYGTNNNCNSNY